MDFSEEVRGSRNTQRWRAQDGVVHDEAEEAEWGAKDSAEEQQQQQQDWGF